MTNPGLAAVTPRSEPHADNARPRPLGFALLLVQLALLFLVFRQFRIEEPTFLAIAFIAFAGFAMHYWLPLAAKEWFVVALSLVAGFLVLDPVVAGLLVAAGLGIFGVLALPIAFGWRLAVIGVLFVALTIGRATLGFGLPEQFWPLFGALFMLRLIVYLYDRKYGSSPSGLKEFLAYFYLLPNYYFLLFPVVDFTTMRRSRYRRDIHEIAQQGIHWMLRGTVQLLLYRLVDSWRGNPSPATVTSLTALAANLVLTFMLYLRVSGQFHIIVGMLHLFGYDLPETNRNYGLATSFLDLWRRISIYWKDFMVKVFYFPVFFRLRKRGERSAQLIATGAVFIATWALHSYQYFWLRGSFLLTSTDVLFWVILGLLVMSNVALESSGRRSAALPGWRGYANRGLRIAGTMGTFIVLWSLWSSSSFGAWLDLMTWWRVG
jgi:alginate O-acetyltransferase complex protein AlgI